MGHIAVIVRRELASYFATPLAYVFIVIFLVLAGALAFFVGNFFDRGQADLQPFFTFHPWLYLVLIPALAMRLWAEERKSGTIELLLTLPISMTEAVVGKFLASWRNARAITTRFGSRSPGPQAAWKRRSRDFPTWHPSSPSKMRTARPSWSSRATADRSWRTLPTSRGRSAGRWRGCRSSAAGSTTCSAPSRP